MRHYCVLEVYCLLRLWREDQCGNFVCFWKLQHLLLLRFVRKDKGDTIVFWKVTVTWGSEGQISVALLCFGGPNRAKHHMNCVFQCPAQQSIKFTLISKAQPSEASYLLVVIVFCEIVIKHLFSSPMFSKAQPTQVEHLLYLEILKERRVRHYCVCGNSAEQHLALAIFAKPQPCQVVKV